MKLQYNLDKTVNLDSEDDDPLGVAFMKDCVESIEVFDDNDVLKYRWIRDSLSETKTEEGEE